VPFLLDVVHMNIITCLSRIASKLRVRLWERRKAENQEPGGSEHGEREATTTRKLKFGRDQNVSAAGG
jgi:hypothetical protein